MRLDVQEVEKKGRRKPRNMTVMGRTITVQSNRVIYSGKGKSQHRNGVKCQTGEEGIKYRTDE
jgi:hypothetical protein